MYQVGTSGYGNFGASSLPEAPQEGARIDWNLRRMAEESNRAQALNRNILIFSLVGIISVVGIVTLYGKDRWLK